jgi:hypothetical protein
MHIFNIFYYNKEYFWTNLQYFIFIHNIFALFIKRWLTLDYFFWVHCNTFTNIYKVKAFSIFDSVKKKNYLTKSWMINTMIVFVYAVASAFKANRVNMMFGNGWKLDSALWVPAIPALKTQVTESSSMLLSVWSGELHCALLSAQWRHAPLFSTVHLKVNSGAFKCRVEICTTVHVNSCAWFWSDRVRSKAKYIIPGPTQ